MKNWKRISLLLIVTTMLFLGMSDLTAMGTTQAVTYQRSGRTSVAKLTASQLASLYKAIPSADQALYNTSPVSSGSYRVGTLSTQSYSQAKSLINYYRKVAGVSNITFTSTLNNSAGYAALVNAANNTLSHTPSKPSGMTSTMYQKGYNGARQSNLSSFYFYAYGTSEASTVSYYKKQIISTAINGQMSDSDSYNIRMLGHRRWILNPNVQTMGIGTAHKSTSGCYSFYTALRVFGSDVTTSTVSDYKFIAWPASGYNLSETFSRTTPWSITLNPSLYQTPSKSSVKVTITRVSDGKVWNLSSATSSSTAYFNVNSEGYGVSNCIIFRPDYSGITKYSGTYTVHVSGLKTKSGASTSLDYKVVFKTLAEASATSTPTQENTITASNFTKVYKSTAQSFSIGATRKGTGKLTYSSNNTSIKVDSTGNVTIAAGYIGQATITIKVAADSTYKAATKQITVKVIPSATVLGTVSNVATNSMVVNWTRNTVGSGYLIQYSKSSTFASGNSSVAVSGNSNIKKTISGLTRGATYYVRIRTYRTVDGVNYYSSWSSAKSVYISK